MSVCASMRGEVWAYIGEVLFFFFFLNGNLTNSLPVSSLKMVTVARKILVPKCQAHRTKPFMDL